MSFILRSGFDATVIAGVEISLNLQWASMAVASQVELLTSQTRLWKSEVIWPVIQCTLGTEWVRWSFASTDVSGTTMKPVCFSNGSRHLLTRLLRAVIDRSATKKKKEEEAQSKTCQECRQVTYVAHWPKSKLHSAVTNVLLCRRQNSAVNTN